MHLQPCAQVGMLALAAQVQDSSIPIVSQENSAVTRTAILLTTLAIALAMVRVLPAAAEPTYTAVSSAKSLTPSPGSCGSVSNPCRTLQDAFAVTAAGGVIDVLDPGNYGPVNITHAVSIQGHGFAGIAVTSGNSAVTVTTSDPVSLDGLLLDGAGVASFGIYEASSAGTLQILNCVINGFYDGILIEPTTGNVAYITIKNTTVLNSVNAGLYFTPDYSASAYGVLDQVTANSNKYGMYFDASQTSGTLQVQIDNSHAAFNSNTGAVVNPGNGAIYATFKNSRLIQNYASDVTVNNSAGAVFIDRNEIGSLLAGNGGSASDGTNIIFSLGGSLGQINPR
jgi:hypothetical protein